MDRTELARYYVENPDGIKGRAKEARFDERLSLVGLMLDSVNEDVRAVIEEEELLRSCMECIKQFRQMSAVRKKIQKARWKK